MFFHALTFGNVAKTTVLKTLLNKPVQGYGKREIFVIKYQWIMEFALFFFVALLQN
jgi:hypothetical protein